jgi:nicotinamide-nucleotide amidase
MSYWKEVFEMENEMQKEEVPSYVKTLKICGMDAQQVRNQIQDLPGDQTNVTITLTAKLGEVSIQVTAQAEDAEKAKTCGKRVVRELKIRFGSSIFATNPETTLEETVVDLLKEQKMTVTTVESCTGGLLSARLTDVAGASGVFKQGFVTYSNRAKRKWIGVKKMTLKKYTAVSEQTAWEMARGGASLTESDVCVSVTGYAGPDGGEDGQPVGLVYIGCNVKGKITVEEYHFTGDRRAIREQAVVHALTLMRKCILENYQI